jgi:5-carboxymethyl-2-hydroxymuconate isomerase
MPHLTVEYSANLDRLIDMNRVVHALHSAALGTGYVPTDALRTRAIRCDHYVIADGRAANLFVAVVLRLAPGRTGEQRVTMISALMGALESALGTVAAEAMLSVECQELDPAMRVNVNNLRETIRLRTAETQS